MSDDEETKEIADAADEDVNENHEPKEGEKPKEAPKKFMSPMERARVAAKERDEKLSAEFDEFAKLWLKPGGVLYVAEIAVFFRAHFPQYKLGEDLEDDEIENQLMKWVRERGNASQEFSGTLTGIQINRDQEREHKEEERKKKLDEMKKAEQERQQRIAQRHAMMMKTYPSEANHNSGGRPPLPTSGSADKGDEVPKLEEEEAGAGAGAPAKPPTKKVVKKGGSTPRTVGKKKVAAGVTPRTAAKKKVAAGAASPRKKAGATPRGTGKTKVKAVAKGTATPTKKATPRTAAKKKVTAKAAGTKTPKATPRTAAKKKVTAKVGKKTPKATPGTAAKKKVSAKVAGGPKTPRTKATPRTAAKKKVGAKVATKKAVAAT